MKRWLLYSVKMGLAVGILVYLLWSTFQTDPEVYSQLQSEAKDWPRLAVAGLLLLIATLFTFVRWYLLVRVLGLTFTLRSAIRLGFVGYFFNFFALGVVGGDIFKAVLLARDHAGRRTEAVMSVLVDRLIGLYGLFLLATAGLFFSQVLFRQSQQTEEPLYWFFVVTLSGCLLATLCLCFPRKIWQSRLVVGLSSVPKLGPYLKQICGALAVYSQHWRTLIVALFITLGTQVTTAVSFWLIATGLPGQGPSLPQFIIIVPLSLVATAVPLPMGGLGALEAMFAYLYQVFSFPSARGLLVALAYRAMTILVALGGIPFFLGGPTFRQKAVREDEFPSKADTH